jgi:hypothetical protein
MAFREVAVIEIREVLLREWLAGAGLRQVVAQEGWTARPPVRYVEAAVAAGLARDGGAIQLTDELVGQVAQAVRPARPGGHGLGREQLESCHARNRDVGEGRPVGRQDRGAVGAPGVGSVPHVAPVTSWCAIGRPGRSG